MDLQIDYIILFHLILTKKQSKLLSVVHGAMGCGQKSFKLVWRCHQLLSGFLAKGYLPRLSRQSRLSTNDRVVIRWYRGLCTDLLAFALQLRKTRKTSARRRLMKFVRPIIASNGVNSLQMRRIGSHSIQEERRKERRKGRGMGRSNYYFMGNGIQKLSNTFLSLLSSLLQSSATLTVKL